MLALLALLTLLALLALLTLPTLVALLTLLALLSLLVLLSGTGCAKPLQGLLAQPREVITVIKGSWCERVMVLVI
jgi:hypothetical protein